MTSEEQADYDEPEMTFAELGVPGPLVHALADEGKRTAFPIQQDTLPDSLAGRDVLGRGRTGSGKTLAFTLPLVTRLGDVMYDDGVSMEDFRSAVRKAQRDRVKALRHSDATPHPRGLILAPTRELANQINDVVAPLAHVYGMTTTTVYGGVRYSRQINDLKAGADIVVACPGRLEDLIEQGALTLDDVRVVVLDEADEMADMGFLPPIRRILKQISPDAQHMLFSATLDHGVDEVVDEFLNDPKVHSVDEVTSAVDLMTHHVFLTTRNDKPALVRKLASGAGRRILFTRTKFQAQKLAKSLTQQGIPAAELHGNLNQNQRDRNLQAFESGSVNVLVATDVAARGIDVSGVELVVQVEPPDDPKSFLHRSGRTARAGKAGDVITVITPDQRRYARKLLHQAGIDVKPLEVKPDSPQVLELVGTPAEPVEGWTLPPLKRAERQGAPGKSRNRRRGRRGEDRGAEREPRRSRSPKGGKRSRSERAQDRRDSQRQQFTEEQREFAQRFLGDVRSVRDDHPAQHDAERGRDGVPAGKVSKKHKKQGKGKRNYENGAKRIQRKEQRLVRDERDEAVKRHERRLKARDASRKGRPAANRKRHTKHKASAPFRTRSRS